MSDDLPIPSEFRTGLDHWRFDVRRRFEEWVVEVLGLRTRSRLGMPTTGPDVSDGSNANASISKTRSFAFISNFFSLAGSSFQANFVNAKHLKFISFVPSEQSHVRRNVEAIFVFADGLWWATEAQLSPIHANSTGPCQLERIYETSVFGRRITMIGNEYTMQ